MNSNIRLIASCGPLEVFIYTVINHLWLPGRKFFAPSSVLVYANCMSAFNEFELLILTTDCIPTNVCTNMVKNAFR